MRFQRRSFRPWRRFSATPRRRFGGGSGTREPRLQQAQFFDNYDVVIDSSSTQSTPAFIIQALTPWDNGPEGGFDRAWLIKGVVFTVKIYPVLFSLVEANTQGLYAAANNAQMFCQLGCNFFVDQVDNVGAPTSLLTSPNGPFITTPPIGSPGSVPADDEFMPTRIVKRKFGTVQTGTRSATGNQERWVDSLANFQWSGTLRKRLSVASRQGFFFGTFGLAPPNGFPVGVADTVQLQASIALTFYYRLAR